MQNIVHLVDNFYRIMGSWGFLSNRYDEARSTLIQIARASGYKGSNPDDEVLRGLRVMAIQDTNEAAVALAEFIIKARFGTPLYVARMTAPAASSAIDEIVKKRLPGFDIVCDLARNFHTEYLQWRREPTRYVIVTKVSSGLYGLVKTHSEDSRTVHIHDPALTLHSRLIGWIQPNDDTTLGIDYDFEAKMDIVKFRSEEEAIRWANNQGWTAFVQKIPYRP
jgi:hypothetical protein